MNKTKIKLIAGIVALFILGVFLGLVGDRLYMEPKVRKLIRFNPEQRKTYFIRRYTEELHLTDAQQVEVRKIIQESMNEISQFMQQYGDEIDRIKQRRDEHIKALLTPEQRQLFDEMKQQRKEHWKKDKRK